MRVRLEPRAWMAPTVLAFGVAGCISISKTANYDFDFEARFRKSTQEIVKRSAEAEQAALKQHRAIVAPATAQFVQRHFDRADELVTANTTKLKQARGDGFADFFDEYGKRRGVLLDFTLKLKPSVDFVESKVAGAAAFPTGKILLNRPLAEGFDPTPDGYDSVLLGILIHEMIHVRDGHALEQWATADGRHAWASDRVLGALSGITALIPFLSIKYDIQYPLSFGATRELPALSEYAADFGAVSLLNRSGYDSRRYIAFLAQTSEEGSLGNTRRNPPGLLQLRVQCLRNFSADHFATDVRGIRIGSSEAGDQIVQTLDLRQHLRLVTMLDTPELLAKEFPGKPGLTEVERRQVVLEDSRKVAFTACAIRNAFPQVPLEDGVLTTPTFDLAMFLQHF